MPLASWEVMRPVQLGIRSADSHTEAEGHCSRDELSDGVLLLSWLRRCRHSRLESYMTIDSNQESSTNFDEGCVAVPFSLQGFIVGIS